MRQPSLIARSARPQRPALRRFIARALVLCAASVLTITPALADETYPTKPVKLTVPFPPGGSSDTAARILADGMSKQLKQTMVVENRAGAAGTIGIASVVRAQPDGYNLGVGPVGGTIIARLIGMQVPYQPADLVPIANIGSLPLVVAVNKDVPANNIKELVALAKSKPGSLSYGTSGAGTPGHLVFEYFKKIAGIDIVHIPYKGDSPLTSDLIGGQVQIGVLTGPAAKAQQSNPKLKFLAVSSAKRYPQMEAVPTLVESGYPDLNIEIWNLLIAPAKTDAAVLTRLNESMNAVLKEQDTMSRLDAQGYLPPVAMSLEQAREFVETDRKKWETIVNTTGVKIGQ